MRYVPVTLHDREPSTMDRGLLKSHLHARRVANIQTVEPVVAVHVDLVRFL